MAALTQPRFLSRFLRLKPQDTEAQAIFAFTEKAHEKTGGPTEELQRVYKVYLESQKWRNGNGGR